MKIKRDNLDVLFSKYIRLKAKNTCEYCGTHKEFKQLQAAHCFGRRKQSTRFDERNAVALCFSCHRLIDENHEIKRNFFMKRLGNKGYMGLQLQANAPQKPDRKLIKIWLEKTLKNYENP